MLRSRPWRWRRSASSTATSARQPALRDQGVLRRSTTALPATHANVLGVLSLFVWSLTLVVVVKYLTFIMRADNKGEGGILALLALLPPSSIARAAPTLVSLGLFGAALLYGDGIITPAISVLERGRRARGRDADAVDRYVVPLTVVILVGLFLVQQRGTAGVGAVFGPVMLVWFVEHRGRRRPSDRGAPVRPRGAQSDPCRPLLPHPRRPTGSSSSARSSSASPAARRSMPTWGTSARGRSGWAWYVVVMPALLLNYFGQGALLLSRWSWGRTRRPADGAGEPVLRPRAQRRSSIRWWRSRPSPR